MGDDVDAGHRWTLTDDEDHRVEAVRCDDVVPAKDRLTVLLPDPEEQAKTHMPVVSGTKTPTYDSTMMFETSRLSARHFENGDLDDFSALCADSEVMRFVGDGSTLTRAEVAHWIDVCQEKYAQRGYGTSAIFEKTSGKFIGYCGVIKAPEHSFDELVYVFRRESWGAGYATEIGQAMLAYVFEISPLDSIFATIEPDNARSKQVAVKLGMTEMPTTDDTVSYWSIRRPGVEDPANMSEVS